MAQQLASLFSTATKGNVSIQISSDTEPNVFVKKGSSPNILNGFLCIHGPRNHVSWLTAGVMLLGIITDMNLVRKERNSCSYHETSYLNSTVILLCF
jgi:hypothetical protein